MSSISFSKPAYTPQLSLPFQNASVSLSATIGGEIFGAHPDFKIGGYYSGQSLITNNENIPAYGYLHAEESVDRPRSMLDFNREKDRGFIKDATLHLPLTSMTYDIYSVSGQGVGGTYRAFRGDVGTVFDPYQFNPGVSGDFGLGNLAHGGVNVSTNITESTSGAWKSDNGLWNKLKFREKTNSDPDYEPFFFKQVGEKVSVDENFYQNIGGEEAVKPILGSGASASASGNLKLKSGATINPSNAVRNKREKRNQTFFALNAADAFRAGLDADILGLVLK
jgi:hypothetical protein